MSNIENWVPQPSLECLIFLRIHSLTHVVFIPPNKVDFFHYLIMSSRFVLLQSENLIYKPIMKKVSILCSFFFWFLRGSRLQRDQHIIDYFSCFYKHSWMLKAV